MKVNHSSGSKIGNSVKSDSASGVKTSLTGSTKNTKGVSDLLNADFNSSARVDLSNRAQDTKKATELARKGLNEVDDAKVAKFQALIDGGKYQVDAAKIADKMVDEHLSNELAAHEASE